MKMRCKYCAGTGRVGYGREVEPCGCENGYNYYCDACESELDYDNGLEDADCQDDDHFCSDCAEVCECEHELTNQ